MGIAVLADIHGNYEALKTCVQYALDRGITTFIFLGDYLGELAFPKRTLDFLYRLKEIYDCTFIRGNKEEYWLNYRDTGEKGWSEGDSTTGSLYYTYHCLNEKDMDFFNKMKISEELRFGTMEAVTVCHGSPRKVNEKMLPGQQNTYAIMEQSSTRLIICGHTHTQRKITHHGKIVLNPGAVGVPLYSCGKAQFMILHEREKAWEEELVSLAYDVEKEIENLYLAGLDKTAPYWCKTTVQLLRTGKHPHSQILGKAMEYCQKEEGECNWPEIPEKYWEKAYEAFFGQEELQSYE